MGVAAVFTPKDFSLTESTGGIVDAIRRAERARLIEVGKANLTHICYRPSVPKKPKTKCCVDKRAASAARSGCSRRARCPRGIRSRSASCVEGQEGRRRSAWPPEPPADPRLQETPVPAARFVEQLNAQIGNELGRAQPVPRLRGLLRRADDAADGGVLLRAGARGARPRDDDGPVPPRHRRRGRHPRRRGARDRRSPTSSPRSSSRWTRRSGSPSRSTRCSGSPARSPTSPPSSSCSGSSRSRSRRSPR